MKTAKEGFALRKAGRLREAYALACELSAANPGNAFNRSLQAWCLFDLLKEIKDPFAPLTPDRAQRLREIWETLAALPPDALEYRLLFHRTAEKGGTEAFKLLLARGLPRFQSEDFERKPTGYKGKTFPSLVEQTAKHLHGVLKQSPHAPAPPTDRLSAQRLRTYADWMAQLAEKFPDNPYLIHYRITALRRLGEHEQALLCGKERVRRLPSQSWVWRQLAAMYPGNSPERTALETRAANTSGEAVSGDAELQCAEAEVLAGLRVSTAKQAFSGKIKKPKMKDFAFVEGIFVPPDLVRRLDLEEGDWVRGVAVEALDKVKNRMGWRAVLLSRTAAPQEKEENLEKNRKSEARRTS